MGNPTIDLREGTSGEFGGLGIEVGMENGFVKVISPIDDTPAQKAGIKAGDLIIKLDERSVKGMSLNEAVDLMRGKPGDAIKLTIIRENEEKPLVFTIIRDVIKIKSVRFDTLEPGFGYLRISSFQSHTVEGLRKAIDQLKQDNNNQLKGIILDLRNNPGGILNAAVGVSDMFINKGLIVYTEGRIKDSKLKFNAKPNAKLARTYHSLCLLMPVQHLHQRLLRAHYRITGVALSWVKKHLVKDLYKQSCR